VEDWDQQWDGRGGGGYATGRQTEVWPALRLEPGGGSQAGCNLLGYMGGEVSPPAQLLGLQRLLDWTGKVEDWDGEQGLQRDFQDGGKRRDFSLKDQGELWATVHLMHGAGVWMGCAE